MKSITALPSLVNKKVLIRVDYNVPMRGNRILDARRIESSYQTIDAVLKKGGTPILIAHRGDSAETLKPVAAFLSKRYKTLFLNEWMDQKAVQNVLDNIQKKTVVLLENIRKNPGEEKNDIGFAKKLAALGDIYINDAFSVSHRAHASLVGVPKLLPSYGGFQLEKEISTLTSVISAKRHPFLFILGGAKFGTKIPLLERFSKLADNVIITGAILNDFYKVAGMEVGKSVVEEGYDSKIQKLLKNPKLLLPTDVVVKRGVKSSTVYANEVQKTDKIVDIGAESVQRIVQKIKKAKLVVWNGPTGWYEGGFDSGTVELAKALVTAKTKAIIGGGDTAEVIGKVMKNSTGHQKRIFISTGGGAALDFLADGNLVAIAALGK